MMAKYQPPSPLLFLWALNIWHFYVLQEGSSYENMTELEDNGFLVGILLKFFLNPLKIMCIFSQHISCDPCCLLGTKTLLALWPHPNIFVVLRVLYISMRALVIFHFSKLVFPPILFNYGPFDIREFTSLGQNITHKNYTHHLLYFKLYYTLNSNVYPAWSHKLYLKSKTTHLFNKYAEMYFMNNKRKMF